MNGLLPSLAEGTRLVERLGSLPTHVRVVVCPPATLIQPLALIFAQTALLVGAQDCHAKSHGPYTGDLSAPMLREAGASLVVVGHSERRAAHGETNAMVRAKATAASEAGLTPIICVGEELADRQRGRAEAIVTEQLDGSIPDEGGQQEMIVAYEPVWAIGSGLTPSAEEIGQMHRFIRERLLARFGRAGASIAILYGGSLKPANAAQILRIPNVDGGLVGGASLAAADFIEIISAAPMSSR